MFPGSGLAARSKFGWHNDLQRGDDPAGGGVTARVKHYNAGEAFRHPFFGLFGIFAAGGNSRYSLLALSYSR